MNKTIELTEEETKTLGIILRSFINAEEAMQICPQNKIIDELMRKYAETANQILEKI